MLNLRDIDKYTTQIKVRNFSVFNTMRYINKEQKER